MSNDVLEGGAPTLDEDVLREECAQGAQIHHPQQQAFKAPDVRGATRTATQTAATTAQGSANISARRRNEQTDNDALARSP